ncbi:hypothetical protein ENSA5_61790 [Enhygromyxa salina]|uniref:Membrane metalloprotease n=2 Tax=Enhygromyxa salina TaxID=215803 RepID=A0A2S9XD14_9BACT|nr:hypothetical protein ENSA5_61790 [Enhygromyxa salina]
MALAAFTTIACANEGEADGASSATDESSGSSGADAEAGTSSADGDPDAGTEGGSEGAGEGTNDGGSDTGEELPQWAKLIRSDPYPRLVIELDWTPGFEPQPEVADDILALFSTLLDKPGGIELVMDEVITAKGEGAWTSSDRVAAAQEYRTLEIADDAIKVHVMFVDGHAAEDDEMSGAILGYAWGTTIMMFKDTIQTSCANAVLGPLQDQLCRDTEYLIWSHEFGHVIGLVDNGLPMVMDHKDPVPEHGDHDENSDCVMYWAYTSTDALDSLVDRLLANEPPIEFDDACLADIEAAKQ